MRPDFDFDGKSFCPRSAAGNDFLSAVFAEIFDDDLTQTQVVDIIARAQLAGLVVRRVG